MLDLSVKIANLLKNLAPVELAGSEKELTLPMIIIQQAVNASVVRFDKHDFLTESRYQIDCYAETPKRCVEMAEAVNEIMHNEGWQRTSGRPMGRQRFTLMYKAVVDEKYNVYSKE